MKSEKLNPNSLKKGQRENKDKQADSCLLRQRHLHEENEAIIHVLVSMLVREPVSMNAIIGSGFP